MQINLRAFMQVIQATVRSIAEANYEEVPLYYDSFTSKTFPKFLTVLRQLQHLHAFCASKSTYPEYVFELSAFMKSVGAKK